MGKLFKTLTFLRVLSNKELVEGTVPSNKELVDRTVPSYKDLVDENVPSNSIILLKCILFLSNNKNKIIIIYFIYVTRKMELENNR